MADKKWNERVPVIIVGLIVVCIAMEGSAITVAGLKLASDLKLPAGLELAAIRYHADSYQRFFSAVKMFDVFVFLAMIGCCCFWKKEEKATIIFAFLAVLTKVKFCFFLVAALLVAFGGNAHLLVLALTGLDVCVKAYCIAVGVLYTMNVAYQKRRTASG